MGSDSFRYRIGVEEVTLSEGVEEINTDAFRTCWMREINLPESLKVIRGHAFLDCDALEKVEIPEGCEVFDLSAFDRCGALKEIWIKGLNTNITYERGLEHFGSDTKIYVVSEEQKKKVEGFLQKDDIENVTVLLWSP